MIVDCAMVLIFTCMPAFWNACCRNWAACSVSGSLVELRVKLTGLPVCCCTSLTSLAACVGLYLG